jgi:hypothetical protein
MTSASPAWPIDLDDEQYRYIGEQHQRQPFEILGVLFIRNEHLQGQGQRCKEHGISLSEATNHELGRRTHG